MSQQAEADKSVNAIEMVGVTDTGRMRAENEDAIRVSPQIGLAVLADGMGGHQAGEVASGLAIDMVTRHFVETFAREIERKKKGETSVSDVVMEVNAVYDAVQLANNAIHEMAQARPECAGMGSTLVIVVFYDDKICVGHVGDSRLYRYRAGELKQVTEDHSVIQELVSRGLLTLEEAKVTVGKNLVTRALGVEPTVEPDVSEQPVTEGDIYLICSDGLNDMLSDADMQKILDDHGGDLQQAADQLVAHANERGGADNISVILVRANKKFTRNKKAVKELQTQIKQA
ncbi:MAG TPA: Stp1/IreP family PP2C-type Ser/Thr phosphatase [Burkholderiales bacterium]|nr:Stp1/IreP family PP2C-type Ser/Thr phosphatase [Burkholderiales bacterium]